MLKRNSCSPQLEDGYLRLAIEIVDAFARYRLSGEEWKVLWVVLRKTYGYQKKDDWISLSQFVKYTGMKKPNILRALSKLITKKIVIIKKDNTKQKKYQFNKVYSTWEPLSKKITTATKKPLSKKITSVIKKDNRSLSKKIPTIDNYTKENIQKKERQALKFKKLQEEKKALTQKFSIPKGGSFYEWQDRAVRIARQLGIATTPSWFKFFKKAYQEGKRDLLNATYSKIADLSLEDTELYFYKTFNQLKDENVACNL